MAIVLQISSGMYFTTDKLHETVHRRTLYSNAARAKADDIELPMGTLRFSNGHDAISPVTIEVVDRLETTNSDGSKSFHIATNGEQLINDAADVVAFGLNITMSHDVDLVRRLVQHPQNRARHGDATKRLRRTFDASQFIQDEEFADLHSLCENLLVLHRPYFEAAMRAIRRVADASILAAEDVALSYTLFVAALESLSKDAKVPPMTWGEFDGRKRSVVDNACEGLAPDRIELIRGAVLQIDQLSIRRKFRAFVLEHVNPEFYREEATPAESPIRAVDLPRALDFAYKIRSRSMHDLRDLAPELWQVPIREDTIWFDGQRVLTLEGLSRLCRHVIRQFIKRAPTDYDSEFQKNYRDAIPGSVQIRLAPQMWVGNWNDFPSSKGPVLLNALLEMTVPAFNGESGSIVDMSVPLERIEQLLPGEAKSEARIPLIATYFLWHSIAPKEFHRPNAQRWISKFEQDLDTPSTAAFAVGVVLGIDPPWTTLELESLVNARHAELQQGGRRIQELPNRLDAAFQVGVAKRLWNDGRESDSIKRIELSIELLPGDQQLIELEKTLENGDFPEVHLRDFVMGQKGVGDEETIVDPSTGAND